MSRNTDNTRGPGARLPQPANPESIPRRRNLYVIEVLIGLGLVGLVIAIFYNNNLPERTDHPKRAPGQAGATMVTLTDENWQKEVVESTVPVVVDFWAPWCGPCRQIAPIVEAVADRYAGKVKVGKLNVDEAPEVAARYRIESIPRVYVFHGGPFPRKTMVGLTSEATIARAIDSVLE